MSLGDHFLRYRDSGPHRAWHDWGIVIRSPHSGALTRMRVYRWIPGKARAAELVRECGWELVAYIRDNK